VNRIIELARYAAFIAVAALLLASLLAFILGAVHTVEAALYIVKTGGHDQAGLVYLVQIMDMFLIATVFFVFAASLYELFIGKLNLPEWLVAHTLEELKAKLGGVLILIMAGTFLENFIEWKNAQDTMYFGIAMAVVSAVLIALGGHAKKA